MATIKHHQNQPRQPHQKRVQFLVEPQEEMYPDLDSTIKNNETKEITKCIIADAVRVPEDSEIEDDESDDDMTIVDICRSLLGTLIWLLIVFIVILMIIMYFVSVENSSNIITCVNCGCGRVVPIKLEDVIDVSHCFKLMFIVL